MRSTSAKPKNVRENPHPQPIAKNNKPAIMMLSPARRFVTPGSETPFSSLDWTEPHTYLEWCRAASTSWIDSICRRAASPPRPTRTRVQQCDCRCYAAYARAIPITTSLREINHQHDGLELSGTVAGTGFNRETAIFRAQSERGFVSSILPSALSLPITSLLTLNIASEAVARHRPSK